VPIDPSGTHLLRCDAAAAFGQLDAAYRVRFGEPISITSSYRSYDNQVRLKQSWCDRGRCEMAATPGNSNHGWGLALDLGGGINDFGTPQHDWLQAHGPAYGWHHPPWARQGGGKEEPWHWEFGSADPRGGTS
jgi:LAS superfamily LD-carboxypeptidase LdcB